MGGKMFDTEPYKIVARLSRDEKFVSRNLDVDDIDVEGGQGGGRRRV
jgi:hypothetical protein